MAEQRLSHIFSGFNLADITIDEQGRVTITNPTIAHQLLAMKRGEHVPQTTPINLQDPTFLDWVKHHRQSRAYAAATTAAAPRLLPQNGDGGDGGGGSGGGGVPQPLSSFHAYANFRPQVDWNTCGQAAIASITDFHHKDPYSLPRTSQGYWNDGEVIDAIKAGGFGPDVVFGWGTTGGRVRDALNSYGLRARVGYSGFLFADWPSQWNSLLENVYYFRLPVPVLVDLGSLGGPAWTAHWPIAWRMDYTPSGMVIYLANCPWAPQVSQTQFLDAWACRQLPYGFNHCGVYCSG